MKTRSEFLEWLRQNGAEVLAPTNSYEYARFRAQGAVHVIYEGRKGLTANGFGAVCLESFNRNQQRLDMGITKKPRNSMGRLKVDLVARDGSDCFFCLKPMADQDMTIEHLVSRHKGGPDHMDNLVLAHMKCNGLADNRPLVEKIKIREMAMLQIQKEKK